MKVTQRQLQHIIREELQREIKGKEAWNKKFPNTLEGAKDALKAMSGIDGAMIDAASGRSDPQVEGVWALYGVGDEIDGPDAIVYLKGYREPHGGKREMNDFELGELR